MKFIAVVSISICCLIGGPVIAGEMSMIYKFKDWEIRTDGQRLLFGTEGRSKTLSFFGFSIEKGNCFANLEPFYLTASLSPRTSIKEGAYAMGSLISEKSETTLNFKVVGQKVTAGAKRHVLVASSMSKEAVETIIEHETLLINLKEPRAELGDMADKFEVFSLQGSKATILKALDTCNLMTEGKPL